MQCEDSVHWWYSWEFTRLVWHTGCATQVKTSGIVEMMWACGDLWHSPSWIIHFGWNLLSIFNIVDSKKHNNNKTPTFFLITTALDKTPITVSKPSVKHWSFFGHVHNSPLWGKGRQKKCPRELWWPRQAFYACLYAFLALLICLVTIHLVSVLWKSLC